MAKLHPDTVYGNVTLLKGTSMSNRAGHFKLQKARLIDNLEHVAWLKPKPAFQVQELDADMNVVEDSLEKRRPKPAGPTKVVKLGDVGDGWGDLEMKDKAAEEEHARATKAVADMEAEWLKEQESLKEQPEEEKAPEQPEEKKVDPANSLTSYAPEDKGSEEAAVQAEVFQEKWDPKMRVPRLAEFLEARGIDSTGMLKREMVKALEASDEEE